MDYLPGNGINAVTGNYLLPPLSVESVAKAAMGEELEAVEHYDIQLKLQQVETYALEEGRDPRKLSESGWGIVLSDDSDPAILEALSPLLAHRENAAGELFAVFCDQQGYHSGESKQQFLRRLPHRIGGGSGVGPGPADPEKVPYYLLIVGDPADIPFRFQQQLDVQYAVGRLHFERLDDYAAYAASVVNAERSPLTLSKQMCLFGVRNLGDPATEASADRLMVPLGKELDGFSGWKLQSQLAANATKANLRQLMTSAAPPALLLTASHGMGFPNGHKRQLDHQGALLCQDWPGVQEWGPNEIPPDFYFSADDLLPSAKLNGMMAFLFACYGGGVPKYDEFWRLAGKQRLEIARTEFVARLPQRLLASGTLAVVGHVERAWTSSFLWPRAGEQIAVFRSTLKRLMSGLPIGAAMEDFNVRYAELATDLTVQLEDIENGASPNHLELAQLWTASNDARNYIVLGDPAVRVSV